MLEIKRHIKVLEASEIAKPGNLYTQLEILADIQSTHAITLIT